MICIINLKYDRKQIIEKEKEKILIEKVLLTGYYEPEHKSAHYIPCKNTLHKTPIKKYI